MFTNGLSPVHLLILLVLLVLLLGGKKLPQAARGIGQSLRIFKAEIGATKENEPEDTQSPADPKSPGDTKS